MDRHEKRILRLRNHVLNHKYKYFIEDIAEAFDLAIKENTIYLSDKTVDELKDIAKEKGLEGYSKLKKEELIELLTGGE